MHSFSLIASRHEHLTSYTIIECVGNSVVRYPDLLGAFRVSGVTRPVPRLTTAQDFKCFDLSTEKRI